MDNSNVHHVWKSTVALLGRISSPDAGVGEKKAFGPGDGRCASKKTAPARVGVKSAHAASFSIVERISERSIVVCWCDATLGHYGEQLWMRAVARRSTHCVLSGLRVRRGDIVYRPSTRGQRPANCEEVILAVMLDGVDASVC